MSQNKCKKTNKWEFRTYIIVNGKKTQIKRCGFKTKSEAKFAELKFLSQSNTKNDNIIFSELYESYIKHKRLTLKAQSFRSIDSRFRNHILPFFKDYKINCIKKDDIDNWKNHILEKNFSYTYNKNLYIALVNIFNYACDFYDLKVNIASKSKNFVKNEYNINQNYWTFDEFKKFIDCVNDIQYYSLYVLLYYTGMRLGEALALTWNDLVDKEIHIYKTISKEKNDNGEYIINTPKTKSSIRNILLDNYTYITLLDLKRFYKRIINFSNDWYIFGGIQPLARTTITRKKNYYCKIAKVKQIKMHEFRHSNASLLISNRVKVSAISERLGHANISTTLNIYSHLMPNDKDEAVSILNEINNKK